VVTHSYGLPGLHTVVLTATNCTTASAWVTHTLTVLPPCDPVQDAAFTWAPFTPTVGQEVVFTGTATGTLPITYTWKLDVGDWREGPVVTHSYSLPGLHTVVLTATNCTTVSASVKHALMVLPSCGPVQGAAFTWMPLTPTVGQEVAFTGTATGTLPITYTWKLDAGSWREGPVVTHSYSLPGLHTVVLTATNCRGVGLSRAARDLTVAALPAPVYWLYLPLVLKLP
jgi:PKD repeat protein